MKSKKCWAIGASLFFVFFSPNLFAEQYLTEAEALKLAFPKSTTVNIETHKISDVDRREIKQRYGIEIFSSAEKFYIGKSDSKVDGFAMIDHEIGKSEPITFIVALDASGRVRTVAIMEFRETRGWEVKEPRFLRQFSGKKSGDHIRLNDDIVNLSGATLSSQAVAKGVKKTVVLVDYFNLKAQGK